MRRVSGLFALLTVLALCSCGGATRGAGTPALDSGLGASQEAGPDGQADADASAQPEGGDAQGDSGGADGPDAEAGPSALSGVYSGYIESFMFPDASDTLLFTLTFHDDGTVTGTVRFGNAPLIAPPTDPNVGYPPSYQPGSNPLPPTLEGFSYSVVSGTYMAPRLQLQVVTAELWKQWCELQTTIYPRFNSGAGAGCGEMLGYGCLPNVGGGGAPGGGCQWFSCDKPTPTAVDCGKLWLCGFMGPGPCTCTSTSCTVVVGPTGTIKFDTQLVQAGVNGSVTGLMDAQVLNVHLTRMP